MPLSSIPGGPEVAVVCASCCRVSLMLLMVDVDVDSGARRAMTSRASRHRLASLQATGSQDALVDEALNEEHVLHGSLRAVGVVTPSPPPRVRAGWGCW